ncbi:conserved exported hypothetical protein [Luteimonas sp. 9C]|uniref:hypothetical protein n=1 Tax=Luteimonas sp. 9C TaxID=2653148 RepID=UPI0012F3F33A|nr:hypothetical protein [Luteimonas sp. 9C]VXB93562.1 conserved exported hypothetical protein [Luteimonas sp. 9C]
MTIARITLALVVSLAAAGCQQMAARGNAVATAPAACAGASPVDAAETFFRQVVTLNPRGLPSAEAMRTLGPLLSSGMQASIAHARVRQQAEIAASPDDKPSFIEGSLFTSLFEGPTAVLSAEADPAAPTRVAVGMRYAGEAETRWRDHALMRCENAQWRVDDVELGGDWEFASGGRLRDALDAR